jgi:hypothetical protein
MSIFEIMMLVCFAAGWPFSIYKSYTSRVNSGKSLIFLIIVIVGYVSGIIHKLLYSYDGVICLYILNGLMVSIDIILYWRNARLATVANV